MYSDDFPFESQFVEVLGSKIHFVEEGKGNGIVFIHGNPTSSYLWRNILPFAARQGRAIAPGFKLSDEAQEHYETPYPTIGSRKPTAQWPREIPFSTRHWNYDRLVRIRDGLKRIGKPMLLLYAKPGGIISGRNRKRVLGYLPDDAEAVNVGTGIHFLQEAVPEAIGEALERFLAEHHA